MNRQETGEHYERLAERYLTEQGCKLLQRNARYRCGELDLIMQHANQLLFIEVRYRRYSGWGGAVESVDYRKQRKLIRAAEIWLAQHPRFANSICRFDLVTIDSAEVSTQCIWYKDAFRPS